MHIGAGPIIPSGGPKFEFNALRPAWAGLIIVVRHDSKRLMTSIHVKRYYPSAAPLKRLIKYFWVLDSRHEITLDHNILPMANIDMIFNFKAQMTFESGGETFNTPGNIYFSGLTDSPKRMNQQGEVLTIGVAFFPAGFFPFFKIPVTEFKNGTFGLDALLNNMTIELEDRLRATKRVSEKVAMMEHFFLGLLDPSGLIPKDTATLLNHFHASQSGVRDFCRVYGVHPRKLERLFGKYVGTTPKRFIRLNRFQGILNRLVHTRKEHLTTLAHAFDFYDQAHFIKDFKVFTGSSPSAFLKEKHAFKQIMKIC